MNELSYRKKFAATTYTSTALLQEDGSYTVCGVWDTLVAKLIPYTADNITIYSPIYYSISQEGTSKKFEIEAIQYYLNRINSNLLPVGAEKSYVYFCTVDGDVKYIGKGEGARWKHCTSGASHVRQLNRDLFTDKEICVYIVKQGMTDKEALTLEAGLILNYAKHNGKDYLYNSQCVKGKLQQDYIHQESLISASRLVCKIKGDYQ